MASLKPLVFGTGLLALGGGAGIWVGSGMVSKEAATASNAASAEAGGLRSDLAAARATIASLEAQLAQARVAGAPTTGEPAPAAGPADLNTIFQQAKPLLQSLGPLLDNARRRGTKAVAERRVAALAEKYALSAEQQEAIKKWFDAKSEADAAKGRELLNKPGATLRDVFAAGRGGRPDEGLDAVMADTLSPEQLASYQADRLQERAGTVEKEASRRVAQLNEVVQLDETQQDKVFAIMARSSPDYDPSMRLEGLGSEVGPLDEGASRDEAILAVLRPDQRAAYEADRQRRRSEAAKNLEALGLKLPADLEGVEAPGR